MPHVKLNPNFRRIPLSKKLYVGNLGYNVTKNDLEQMFGEHGTVNSAQVITDRDTGSSKGFGFVEMASDQEAQAAISSLNGKSVDGRSLIVNEARPQEPRTGGGGGFGGRGGAGGGRGPGGGGGRGGFGGGGGGGKRY
jgi:RNA recognition motif-containing protein